MLALIVDHKLTSKIDLFIIIAGYQSNDLSLDIFHVNQ